MKTEKKSNVAPGILLVGPVVGLRPFFETQLELYKKVTFPLRGIEQHVANAKRIESIIQLINEMEVPTDESTN